MTIRERISQLDRAQHGLWFKIVASALIAILAVSAGVTYVVYRHAVPVVEIPEASRPKDPPKDAKLTPEQLEELKLAKSRYEATEATARTINDILARKADSTVVWVGLAVGGSLAIAVVWLGLGLTCLVIAVAAALPLLTLISFRLIDYASNGNDQLLGIARSLGDSADENPGVFRLFLAAWHNLPGWPWFIASVGALALSFFVLIELLRLLLSGPSPITAIARNVVSEALRMKISVVFIVMFLLGLAALPGLLDDSTPLRYRVQSFLQYGTGGTFWVIALLTLFLAVGSVAFEQRDRTIWQTMTKPVAAWQYLFGKWLGVVGIAAVLLTVTASGVFLFTGYLRNQKAGGEEEAYVARSQAISEDRLVLETQVLTARVSAKPIIPPMDPADEARAVADLMIRAKQGDAFLIDNEEARAKMLSTLREDRRAAYFSLRPGESKVYRFTGLKQVRDSNRPMTLRYKVSVGADDPRSTTKVTFIFTNTQPRVQEVPLGQALTIPVSPGSIEITRAEPDRDGRTPADFVPDGVLDIQITNGDLFQAMNTSQATDPAIRDSWMNKESMSIPPDGLEISFPVGGYESNFVRVMIVLWLKLAFLAMVGVVCSTYLSFSVASLMAFGTFLLAESAGFLSTSLEYFDGADAKGNIDYFRTAIRAIAVPLATAFKNYADLKPTANLVDGRMVDWITVAIAAVVLGALTAILYAIGVTIFRKRELATYSGQ